MPAPIHWGAAYNADGYIVERNFNESFNQALLGYSWQNLNNLNKTWEEFEAYYFTWVQLETQTGLGAAWEMLEYKQLNWSQIEAKIDTWTQLENLPISFEIFKGLGTEVKGTDQGRTWYELDQFAITWSEIENLMQSWQEWEAVTLSGLSWEHIAAMWRTFAEWDAMGLTFTEWEALNAPSEFRGFTDYIPIGAKTAIYRIRSYNKAGETSTDLTTDTLPIIPIFYRENTVDYPVKAGKHYRFLLRAEDVYGLEKIRMKFRYHPDWMELTNLVAHSTNQVIKAGDYPNEHLKIYSNINGDIWFQSTRQLADQECFSGAIALVEFIARKSGKTALSLS